MTFQAVLKRIMKDKNKMLTVIQQVKENYNMYNIQTEADELGFSRIWWAICSRH